MEASHHFLHKGGLQALPASLQTPAKHRSRRWRLVHMPRRSSSTVSLIITNPTHTNTLTTTTTGESTPKTMTVTTTTKYHDNWFDRFAIRYLTHSIQAATGVKNKEDGYDGLAEVASMVARSFDVKSQQELVTRTIEKAVPVPILKMIRTILPPSKAAREIFAVTTTLFFPWLIGPCEVKESDFNGRIEKNVVYIPKCRFLESTNCVGMCTNLCKVPSQKFIQDSLGMPLNMVPNFEDMSCQMIFGQSPPADDPVLKQPCYHSKCKTKQIHGVNCSS